MELLIVILLIGFSIFQAISKAKQKEDSQQPHPGDIFLPHGDDPWADLTQPREPEPVQQPTPVPAVTHHAPKAAQAVPAHASRTTKSRNASHQTATDHTHTTVEHIMDDFDPAKAIIYAEIMNPKFKEYNNCIDD